MENLTTPSHKQLTLPGKRPLQSQRRRTLSGPLCTTESRCNHIYSPRPCLAGQFSSLLQSMPLPLPGVDSHSEIMGSTALRTPSVESASAPSTPLYGPVGMGRNAPFPASRDAPIASSDPPFSPKSDAESEERGLLGGSAAKIYLYQSHVDTSEGNGQEGAPHQLPSFQGAYDESLLRLGTLSLVGTAMPSKRSHVSAPRFRPTPRHVHVAPPPSHLPPFPGASLVNWIGHLLEFLDGTFRTQHQVCDQVLRLGITFGLAEAIPIIVECTLEHGVTQGYPRNTYVAGFCRYFLPKVSQGWVGPNSPDCTKHYQGLIRSTFTATFCTWWTPLPHVDSTSHRFVVRVASFYGHLYLEKTLDEDVFRACLRFLSQLTPLPVEGLRSLLSGDITGYSHISE